MYTGLFFMFIQFGCLFVIMYRTFQVVKTNVDLEFKNVDLILKENISNQELIPPIENRRTKLKR